eukprot:12881635-Prorocentrum_lima.AAC.1
MAREFSLFTNPEATEFFAAAEERRGSQEPGKVQDQGGQPHQEGQQQPEVKLQMQQLSVGPSQGRHSPSVHSEEGIPEDPNN